ncbi:hypothetical protein [Chitinophaga sp. MM2321]|uniref:hypothetical protein n=1 Tax=Chitinophaga sp. MM2321 TaxID=3137178 RepID=UPI0032D586D4
MKTLSLKSIACLLAAALAVSSCRRNNNEVPLPSPSEDGKMLSALLSSYAPKFESFTVDAAAGGVITTTNGTKYTIPPNVFTTKSGVPVTGAVAISIKEILNVSSMILSDKPTMTSDGRILVSYGEFFMKAEQNKQNLALQPNANGRAIQVQVPAKPGDGVKEVPMWDGDTTVTLTQNGFNHINQPVTVSSEVTLNKGMMWTQIDNNYAIFNSANGTMDFRLDSLIKWTNCDGLYYDPNPKTTVMAYFTNHFNAETGVGFGGEQPSMLFFKPRYSNTVVKFYNVILAAPTGKEGFHSYQSSIPVGMEGTFLAISAVNGQLYAEQKDVTIGTPATGNDYTTVSFDLQAVDANSLIALINSMNSK